LRSERIFRAALVFSLLAHAGLLAVKANDNGEVLERIVRIPVLLQEEPPPPLPPPPPPPKPEEPLEKKRRPKTLAKRIEKVVEEEGLRAAELVEAETGYYEEEVEPEPPPPPPKPVPKPKPKPKVDKVKLVREFLAKLRGELMIKKKYPLAAQRMGVTGAVSVSFAVMPDSTFSDIKLKRSSGHGVLDAAAIDTIEKLSGKLPRPKDLGDIALKTSVVLRYELNG
jgi:protein TonB